MNGADAQDGPIRIFPGSGRSAHHVGPQHIGVSAMSDNPKAKTGSAFERRTGMPPPGLKSGSPGSAVVEDFPAGFEKSIRTVIRPAFESLGNDLKALGYDISISEDAVRKIALHIVPPGVSKSIHPDDWFPTLTFFANPATKSIGLQGRNARRNSEPSPGPGAITSRHRSAGKWWKMN
jgi:hypothetical protein